MDLQHACWAILVTDTRPQSALSHALVAAYHREQRHYRLFQMVFAQGIPYLIAIVAVPHQRDDRYYLDARRAMIDAVSNPERIAWYQRHAIHVSVAGDQAQLAAVFQIPTFPTACHQLSQQTRPRSQVSLIYLFRGDWISPAEEEAQYGYTVGMTVGRPPTRDELVQAYYTQPLPPLTAYISVGPENNHPAIRAASNHHTLLPPFISRAPHWYELEQSPLTLTSDEWQHLIQDYLRR